jgi:hypothetical protein
LIALVSVTGATSTAQGAQQRTKGAAEQVAKRYIVSAYPDIRSDELTTNCRPIGRGTLKPSLKHRLWRCGRYDEGSHAGGSLVLLGSSVVEPSHNHRRTS